MQYTLGALSALILAGLVACAATGTHREVEQARSALQDAQQEKTLLEEKIEALRSRLDHSTSPEETAVLQAQLADMEARVAGKEAAVASLSDRLQEAEAKRGREREESSHRWFTYLDTFLAVIGFGGVAGKGGSRS